jgi:hypothetical protein
MGADNIRRTHRERKELYIKALEQEILRLKETFSATSRDKDTLAKENAQLKHLLAQHGIAWSGTGGVDELALDLNAGYASSGSMSGSYAPGSQGFSSPQHYSSTGGSLSPPPINGRNLAQQQRPGIDYDQAGIDFVLTYDNDPTRLKNELPPT